MLKKEVKKIFELDILNLFKQGLKANEIAIKLNISKPNLSYYLKSLKESGRLINLSYGVWEVKDVKSSTKDTFKPKDIRGHAFIWKVKIPREIDGYNNLTKLNSRKIKFKLVGIKKTPSINILNKKVWLGNKNIIIFDSNSYMGKNAVESRKYAVFRLITILEAIERELNINLKSNEGYIFKPSRQHYSIIKNDLAIQCNQNNEKINIKYHGETWFIVDNSYNLDECEHIHKETALLDNLGIQKYFNSHKETDFKVTPEFILNTMKGIQSNQLIFAKNMESHILAIQKLGNAVDRLENTIKKKKVSLKEYQSTLNNY
jgi:DNA-binding Lrp family transcriptional regulator